MRKYFIATLGTLLAAGSFSFAQSQEREVPESSQPEASAQQRSLEVEVDLNTDSPKPQPGSKADAAMVSSRLTQLNDFHLATWVLIENDTQVRISKFAEQQAKTPQVKDFAKKMAESHGELISKLRHQVESVVATDSTVKDGEIKLDYSAILRAVGEQLEKRTESGRQEFGFRGTRNADNQNPDAAAELDNDDVAADDGVFDEDAQKAFRRNLPALLDIIEQSVTGADAERTGMAFIELKRQLGEKFAESLIKEMKQGQHVDQAYLGAEIVAHLKLIDTMEVAKQHASPELKLVLDDSLEMTEKHLNEARLLMKLINVPSN